MFSYKKTNVQIYNKGTTVQTADTKYWRQLGVSAFKISVETNCEF